MRHYSGGTWGHMLPEVVSFAVFSTRLRRSAVMRLEKEREAKSPSSAARDSHVLPLHGGSNGYGLDLNLFYPFFFF